ncbi:MAG: twin-arginine translocation signal domain-containing protein, partial [Acidobacteriota bacterium]
MKTNRRKFLKQSCVFAITSAVLAPSVAIVAQSESTTIGAVPCNPLDPLARLTHADFAAYVGQVIPATD